MCDMLRFDFNFILLRPHSPKGSCMVCCHVMCTFEIKQESSSAIDHFTVVGRVTWLLNGSEAGVDLVLIQTSLFLLCKSSCS